MTSSLQVVSPMTLGGIVKHSLAMVSPESDRAIAKAFGLDAATRRIAANGFESLSFWHKDRH